MFWTAQRRYRLVVIALAASLALLVLVIQARLGSDDSFARVQPALHYRISTAPPLPDLPDDYRLAASSESLWCQDRFGAPYLEKARDSAVFFCNDESASRFTCFLSRTAGSGSERVDAMCHGRRAVFDDSLKRFRLGCDPRPLTPDELDRGVPRVPDGLPRYWYETGPGTVMDKAVRLDKTAAPGRSQVTTILVKREGDANPWHSLMEIMSLSWSVDLLQMSLDPETNEPFLGPADGATTQVVLLDGHGYGPYIDLWRLFAKMPIRRIHELNASEPVTDIIVPFAGGGNTLWQGDWDDLLCRDSSLVKTFIRRALAHYNVPAPVKDDKAVKVTFIRRTTTRKLIDEETHMQALRERVPHIELTVVDLAAIPFAEQLKVVRGTDLLVGVHGAGLTHLMFLRPGCAAAVEIIPAGFEHRGFRNLAQMLGVGYLRAHAEMRRGEGSAAAAAAATGWQASDVEMDRERLVRLVDHAAKSLYNRGMKSYDVV